MDGIAVDSQADRSRAKGGALMGMIVQKLRDSARGRDCTFEIPGVCNRNPETSVLCHAPSEVKGMGSKGHDFNAAIGCCACHAALDEHRLDREDELRIWLRGCQRTLTIWIEAGLVMVGADPANLKRRPKRKTKWASGKIQSNPTIPSRPFTSTRAALREGAERP
ncbi:DUF1364 domain-containing protein [Mesorhizobium sp. RP14(2022)]|uniref:DUF1364 domain-containing protein n=1 Tax=Mesorhizobium liriopis TaxID=2953882 RepID=A0ABT1CA75_9HYPH|nr:DUF1364 domain-containing protein [Mesorhizobium liriopis]